MHQEQYTDTWTCHIHKKSRHTYITDKTSPHPPRPCSKPHDPPLYPHRPAPNQNIYISHTPPTPLIIRTTLIHSTSAALDTIPEPRVPPICPALNKATPHPSTTSALQSPSHPHTLSARIHATQRTVHSYNSHRIHIEYDDNLTDGPKTTT